MITGDIDSSYGNAYVMGMDVVTQKTEVRKRMGYCPQFDPLFDRMTAREHLWMYARIRGIHKEDIPEKTNRLLETVGLTIYADIPAGTYSGGNKRKLSLALALIGEPSVVFLDEPSSGMDPVSRRFMWDVIAEVSTKCCVILTTHSMEECEALCSRIGIMVSGTLRCLGSVQHLKARFGKGYNLEAKLSPEKFERFETFIHGHFADAIQVEKLSNGILRYEMPRTKSLSLASIFGLMEKNKGVLEIRDYSVSQSSLEQVFIQIAQQDD
uniref:ABC transporter domain-containing protein n=2 Tax=Amorphochlora amoebiformis TaxID=1561963 RepID=A0A7S0D712_9EUKA|mmetsp:Transcript_19259/g.30596  ORF Transcript_19259/g.30596 Transcript_19259/m.30596 type:complete len:268 (+) Transcript_19259:66-869(+)